MRPLAALVAFLLFVLSAVHAYATQPAHQWSRQSSGGGVEDIRALALDGSGNIYAAGLFTGVASFGGSSLTSDGSADIFLAKYDASGTHLWSRRMGGVSYDDVSAMAVDGSGNVYITGFFNGSVSFGGSTFVAPLLGACFLAKYDAGGVHVWSQSFSGTGSTSGRALAVHSLGLVWLAGDFTGTASVGGGSLIALGSNSDTFLAMYTDAGAHLWSKSLGGPNIDAPYSIGLDGLDVCVAGVFENSTDYGSSTLNSAGNHDVVLAKYNSAGTHVWSERVGGTGDETFPVLAVDGTGKMVLTGSFTGTTDLGGGNLVSVGAEDIFLAQFDAYGVHAWSQRFGGTGYDAGAGLAVDGAGSIYLAGSFSLTANFGGAPLNSNGLSDAFFARFDASGSHLWSSGFGGSNYDGSGAVVANGTGAVCLAGSFRDTANFGGQDLTASDVDAFLARYSDAPTGIAPGGAPSISSTLAVVPNPSGGPQRISFAGATRPGTVDFAVHDATGRLVWRAAGRANGNGDVSVEWNGSDVTGHRVSSGVFFVTVRVPGGTAVTQKLIRLK